MNLEPKCAHPQEPPTWSQSVESGCQEGWAQKTQWKGSEAAEHLGSGVRGLGHVAFTASGVEASGTRRSQETNPNDGLEIMSLWSIRPCPP